VPKANSEKEGPIFYTCYSETIFAGSRLYFSFCLIVCFCVKVHFALLIVWSHLILKCSLSTHYICWGAPIGAFAQNFCFTLTNIWLASEFNKCGYRAINKLLTKQNKKSTSTLIGWLHCLNIAMIKFVDEFGRIDYCLCSVLVSCKVMYSFVVKRYIFLLKKIFSP